MLYIEMKPKEGVLFICLEGKLTKNTIDKFYDEVIIFIRKMGVKNIVLNLKKIKTIDSEGQRILFKNFNKKRNEKNYICLENKKILKNKEKFNIVKNELEARNKIKEA